MVEGTLTQDESEKEIRNVERIREEMDAKEFIRTHKRMCKKYGDA